MDEPDFSGMLESLLGNVSETAMGKPSAVEVLVEDHYQHDLQKLLGDRICGLLLQGTLSAEQVTLLSALMRGYRP